jgi:protein-tyrosine phosphatase
MTKILFLCTGNYYRSRFAEFYLRHIADEHQYDWTVDSRGLRISPRNEGPLSQHTIKRCDELQISYNPLRLPTALAEEDLQSASHVIAVKETEHRPLMQEKFPDWENKISYWEVHDLDCATPEQSLPVLQTLVDEFFNELRNGRPS